LSRAAWSEENLEADVVITDPGQTARLRSMFDGYLAHQHCHPLSKVVLDSAQAQAKLLGNAKPPSLPPTVYLPPRRHPKHAPVDGEVTAYLAKSLKYLPQQGNFLTLTLRPDTACRLVDLDARQAGFLKVSIYPAD